MFAVSPTVRWSHFLKVQSLMGPVRLLSLWFHVEQTHVPLAGSLSPHAKQA